MIDFQNTVHGLADRTRAGPRAGIKQPGARGSHDGPVRAAVREPGCAEPVRGGRHEQPGQPCNARGGRQHAAPAGAETIPAQLRCMCAHAGCKSEVYLAAQCVSPCKQCLFTCDCCRLEQAFHLLDTRLHACLCCRWRTSTAWRHSSTCRRPAQRCLQSSRSLRQSQISRSVSRSCAANELPSRRAVVVCFCIVFRGVEIPILALRCVLVRNTACGTASMSEQLTGRS